MIVYRVENERGCGPYGYGGWQDEPHNHMNGRPAPQNCEVMSSEWAKHSNGQYYFGFESLVHLYAWFTPTEIRALSSLGFAIVTIEVDRADVVFGSNQVAFYRERSTHVVGHRCVTSEQTYLEAA